MSDRHGNRPSRAAGTHQHDPSVFEVEAAPSERLDATNPIENLADPAPAVAPNCRIDCADLLGLDTQVADQGTRGLLVGDREDKPVQVRHAHQARQARREVLGDNIEGNEDCVPAAAFQFGRDHLGRAHLLDRMSNDRKEPRFARNVVDFIHEIEAPKLFARPPLLAIAYATNGLGRRPANSRDSTRAGESSGAEPSQSISLEAGERKSDDQREKPIEPRDEKAKIRQTEGRRLSVQAIAEQGRSSAERARQEELSGSGIAAIRRRSSAPLAGDDQPPTAIYPSVFLKALRTGEIGRSTQRHISICRGASSGGAERVSCSRSKYQGVAPG